MSVLRNRQQANPNVAVAVAGQEEPEAFSPESVKVLPNTPLQDSMTVPAEPARWNAPYVDHAQNTRGMRYLYARGGMRQPIKPLGEGPNIGIATWNSEFQPTLVSLHDAGFNDRLFQAGYPGFNLGLSFKTQQNPSIGGNGPGMGSISKPPNRYNMVINIMRGAGRIITPQVQGEGQPK